MSKFSGVLLATDYDDTLYGTNLAISPENRAAISYFVSEGGHFTVSTGRSYVNFAIQMQREQLPINTPVILSNGANIYDFSNKEMLYETHLRPDVATDLSLVCNRFPELGFEAYSNETVYVHNPNEITERHLTRAGLLGHPSPIMDMPAPWTKAILQQDHAYLQKVQQYMLAHWSEAYEVIFSSTVLLELTAKGSHKGSAVLWLANHLGVLRKNIYCIGNGHNDIPMLEISAEPFAPSNCAQAVRERGATILASCDESCIARLIEMLDRRYSKLQKVKAV
ncbi:MAG: HAD-IIB family hydrolase [Evtepia sp.]